MSIFKDELLKFKNEFREFSDAVQFSTITILETLFRKTLRFIFLAITVTAISIPLLAIAYFVSRHFNWVNSIRDFILISAITITILGFAFFFFWASSNSNSYQYSSIQNHEDEALKVQKEILKTQKRIAVSNAHMDFLSSMKRTNNND